jgi:HNH endonuclease
MISATHSSIISSPPAWLALSFAEQRQYAGNAGYQDDPERIYRYDSYVANHRRVARGDLLVLAGRDGLIGFARIRDIRTAPGNKELLRCPMCRTTSVKKRAKAVIPYRCNRGHEFQKPLSDIATCTMYQARYDGAFVPARIEIPMDVLRRACPRYADQLAIQELDFGQIAERAFESAPGLQLLIENGELLEPVVSIRKVQLRAENINAAIARIEKDGVPSRHRARLYELITDSGRRYPAKYLLSLAIDIVTGEPDSFRTFSGGESYANRLLRRLGFRIERIGSTADLMEDLTEAQAEELPEQEFDPSDIIDAREKAARQISMRRGQPAFRRKLLKIYGGACAVTGCRAVQVLEACHIIPYLGPDTNHPCNGLLLRADLHTLFDLGLITIDAASMTVRIAPELHDTEYGVLEGRNLRLPENVRFRPNAAAVEQHAAKAAAPHGM